MKRIVIAASLLTFAGVCMSASNIAMEQRVSDELMPAASEVPLAVLAARGVQIYECRIKKDEPQATEWAFVAPEADLFDSQGNRVGKHYAGPHWENVDGSKVIGSVRARADAPMAGAIPWLLMTTKSVGPPGAFAMVTSIQRIHTAGGAAPAPYACTAPLIGSQSRIPYSAEYVMFRSK